MRILLTTHQFLPDYSGGTEVLVYEVARELADRNHDVRVLTGWPKGPPSTGAACDRYEYEGIPVERVYDPVVVGATAADRIVADTTSAAALRCFVDLVSVWRPDFVQAFHLQRLSAAIAIASVRAAIPTIYLPTDFWAMCPLNQLRLPDGRSCEGPDAESINCVKHLAVQGRCSALAPIHRWLPSRPIRTVLQSYRPDSASKPRWVRAAHRLQERPATMRTLLQSFHGIGAPTRSMVRRLELAGASSERIRLLPYGIDVSSFQQVPPVSTGQRLRLGFIGALQVHKGAHLLIEAIRRLDAHADVEVSLFGDEHVDPSFVASLKARIGSDPRVRFCGTFLRAETATVLATIDVLVVPSTWDENAPLVVLAAGAAGRPVIGSDVPGIADLVSDGVDGRLFACNDAAALAAVLGDLLAHRDKVVALSRSIKSARTIKDYVDDILKFQVSAETVCAENP